MLKKVLLLTTLVAGLVDLAVAKGKAKVEGMEGTATASSVPPAIDVTADTSVVPVIPVPGEPVADENDKKEHKGNKKGKKDKKNKKEVHHAKKGKKHNRKHARHGKKCNHNHAAGDNITGELNRSASGKAAGAPHHGMNAAPQTAVQQAVKDTAKSIESAKKELNELKAGM